MYVCMYVCMYVRDAALMELEHEANYLLQHRVPKQYKKDFEGEG